MNNSDYNDFKNWENNGDDENNPFNPNGNGFIYYGPFNDKFKNLWNKMNSKDEYMDHMKDYLNMDDILNEWSKQIFNQPNKPQYNPKKLSKKQPKNVSAISQEDYFKLIEIRGYLAITEQHAHVKALDKLLNQIKIISSPNNGDQK